MQAQARLSNKKKRKPTQTQAPYKRVEYDLDKRKRDVEVAKAREIQLMQERETKKKAQTEEEEFGGEERPRDKGKGAAYDIHRSNFACDPNFGYPEDLEEFDRMDIPHNFLAIMIGRRRCGKSFFARWFLEPHQHTYDKVIVVTTTKMNQFWSKIVGAEFVHEGWAKGKIVVRKLFDHQKKQIAKRGGPDFMPEDDDHSYDPDNVLLIMDDIISENIHDDKTINELPVAGRHYNIAVMIMTQAPKKLGTEMRDNADLAVIFQQINDRCSESVTEDYLATLRDKHAAISMLDAFTGDYAFIAARLFPQSNDKNERYRKGKASEVPDFTMGGPEQQAIIQREKAREEARNAFSERMGTRVKTTHGRARGTRTGTQRGGSTGSREPAGRGRGSGLPTFRDSYGKTRTASPAFARILGY